MLEKQNEQKSSKVDIHCWLTLARLTFPATHANIVGAAVEFFLYCLFSLKLVRWFLSKGNTACWMVARHIRGGLTIQHSFYSNGLRLHWDFNVGDEIAPVNVDDSAEAALMESLKESQVMVVHYK